MPNSEFKQNLIDKLKNSPPELKIIHTDQPRDSFIKKNLFAGGVVLNKSESDWKLALQTTNEKSWGLPKGKSKLDQPEKEKLLQVAKEKVAHETGVAGGNLDFLSYLGRIERPSRSHNVWKEVHYFVFLSRQNKLDPDSEKHTARWFSLNSEELSSVPEQTEVISSTMELLKNNGFS